MHVTCKHEFEWLFYFFSLLEHQDNNVNEKDVILVSATYGYIIVIESKRSFGRGESVEKSLQQLIDSKDDIEAYLRNAILSDEPDISSDWIFMPMVYCEDIEDEVSYCESCEKHIILGK